MHNTKLMPIRTTVGSAKEKLNVYEIGRSEQAQDLDLTISTHYKFIDLNSVPHQNLYANFLPQEVYFEKSPHYHADGTATFPFPNDLPFLDGSYFTSLFALGSRVGENVSRSLWIDICIEGISEQSLGGICYGGYPYLPYYLTAQGENSANFGLPRELRLSYDSHAEEGFIDAENIITHQEPISHSGVHILSMECVQANKLILRLADFPKIIKKVHRTNAGQLEIEEYWGFIIPYLFVFKYQENMRYAPRVPAGLLGAVQTRNNLERSFFQPTINPQTGDVTEPYTDSCADYLLPTENPRRRFFHLSGASIFGQRRTFSVTLQPGNIERQLKERFVSHELQKGDELRLYIEQSEEYVRCIAGMRITFQTVEQISSALPTLPARLPYLKVTVFELDPIEGVSPIAFGTDPRVQKYAYRLFEQKISANDDSLTCKFVRPSLARYFALVFENYESYPGHVIIEDLELVQSVHISITPRVSHTQLVRALHFRLVGEGLADDYARLGQEGFSFTVERLVAGQAKDVLFTASSLLDLLHTGAAKLYSNYRRHKKELEISKTLGGYSVQKASTRIKGWDRSETGKDLENTIKDDKTWRGPEKTSFEKGKHGYIVLNRQESRVHTQQIGRVSEAFITALADVLSNAYVQDDVVAQINALKFNNDAKLWQAGNGDVWTAWQANQNEVMQLLRVDGLWNANIPPHYEGLSSQLEDLLQVFNSTVLTTLPDDPRPMLASATLASFWAQLINMQDDMNPLLSALLLLNGLSLGANLGASPSITGNLSPLGVGLSGGIGASLGLSVSASSGVPSLIKSSAMGTSGAVSHQGAETRYSYAQYLVNRYSDAKTRTDIAEGQMNREVTREPITEDVERIKGAEIMWQNRLVDIITGTIPLGITLPALTSNVYKTSDDTVRVRFNGGLGDSFKIDVWFDVIEEVVHHDY